MNEIAKLPDWAAIIIAILILVGAATALIGSLGLWRLNSFYERLHAPTLGTTLGTGRIILASMLCFSVLQTRFVLHEILIAIFVTVTTPITLMILVRAALFRDSVERAGALSDMHDGSPPATSELEINHSLPPEAT
jgi:multicomponent K+:H+ antiporter subunit G